MPTKKDAKRILAWVDQWRETLNLQQWTITTHFTEKDEVSNTESKVFCAASTERQFNYLRAAITVYPGFWKEKPEVQWSHIAHEMIHVLLADYDQLLYMAQDGKGVFDYDLDRVRERTTVQITNLVTNVWPYDEEKC